jgi:DNA end-binding protein Ku
MPRTIWNGAISFGLVTIPVGLAPAETRDELDFTLLDRRDTSPIGYQKVNKRTGKPVPSDRIVRGLETERGRYVIVSDEDLRRASPERTQRIDLHAFVDLADVDPRYFDRPYYLVPQSKGEKAYVLLREALRRTGKVGIATVVVRTREHLAALVPHESVLVLDLLRHFTELRDPGAVGGPSKSLKALAVSDGEMKMAERLIQEMSTAWKPARYRDEYRRELLDFVARRAKSGVVASSAEEPATAPRRGGDVIDIAAALRQSLGRSGKRAAGAPRRAGAGSAARTAPARLSHARRRRARLAS